ncbi:MAG: MEDS domain-containing protein [Elusimicrobia bacterium]|nr:MEDS domain-containing protein [Elusimicrobiota bacterium]
MDFSKPLSMTPEGLGPHAHAALIHLSRQEQLSFVVPYHRSGLERGEKCVCVADADGVEALWAALRAAGVDAAGALAKGQLASLSPEEVYLKDGRFDPAPTLAVFRGAIEEARRQGFSGLRVSADMTWSCGGAAAMPLLADYEAEVNRLFEDHPFGAVCQYEYGRFSADALTRVVYTHPLVIFGGRVHWNPFFIPPNEYLRPRDPDAELTRVLSMLCRASSMRERPVPVVV